MLRRWLGRCTCPAWLRRAPAGKLEGPQHAWVCPLYNPKSAAERREAGL